MIKFRIADIGLLTAFVFCMLPVHVASAKDIKGSKDHPLVSRYDGSEIHSYDVKKFDEYDLILGPTTGKTLAEKKALEGIITKFRYVLKAERSSLEVFKNFETALAGAGFETLYSCKSTECGDAPFMTNIDREIHTRGDMENARYMAARLVRPEGAAYIALLVTSNWGAVQIGLHVIEVAAMETDKVTVDADAIGKGLDTEGHIAIYGIYFDSGSDKVKPESDEAMGEIAKLMKARPKLNLLVVGHTDSQGKFDFNTDLSRKRAAAVVKALTDLHGIAAARLTPAGVGYLAPIAANTAEAGRALNRRVELVQRPD